MACTACLNAENGLIANAAGRRSDGRRSLKNGIEMCIRDRDEYDKTGRPEIRMTHEQIAVQVSSAREVVTRMLKRFASDGLVEMKRGSIRLKDIDGLRNIG